MTGALARTGGALLILIILLPAAARGGSNTRYALVIGNNYGHSSEIELDNLHHAEREARRLRDRLIEFGNFDPDRVILATGKGRNEILEAAEHLGSLQAADRRALGELPTLFALFFTGHGLSGKLLTADKPLSASDLASIFSRMDATLTLGFFDACYAGSLDLEAIKAKGAVVTPGFNPVAELPEELLNSEGTLWFASSRPNELSYEDDRLGGLFTHFFIEAFTRADPDGVGVTLDGMWEYARRRTLAYASRYGRSQTPEKIVRNLKARGPLYFSFTRDRNASLVFDEAVEGTFLLRYEYGALVEKVVKSPGQPSEVAVYEGRLVLSRIDAKGAPASRHLKVEPGAEIHIRPQGAGLASRSPGYGESPIRSKGHLPGLELSRQAPAAVLAAGAGYRFSLVRERALGAAHVGTGEIWFGRGPLSLAFEIGYGSDSGEYASWSYTLREVSLRLFAGYGFDLGGPRIDLEAGAGLLYHHLRYTSGFGREPLGGWFGGGVRFLLPLPLSRPWVVLQARAGLGVRLTEGLASGDEDLYFSIDPVFSVGLAVPFVGG